MPAPRDPADRLMTANALGEWWRSDGPLYIRLANALRSALEHGDIPLGSRLPPERTLANTLNVSRTTVVRAYRHLRDKGWIESLHGSGHVIRHPGHSSAELYTNRVLHESISRNPLVRSQSPQAATVVDFTVSRMLNVNPLLSEVMAECQSEVGSLVHYTGYFPQGLEKLRHAVSRYLTVYFGLPTHERQILITSGAQQSRWLAAQAYTPYGENVLIENPTSVGTIDIFRMIGAKINVLPVTANGFNVDRVHPILETVKPRLILVSPTCHSPTGTTMNAEQRADFVQTIDRHQVTTLDDQTFADLIPMSAIPKPLAVSSRSAPILTIGSLSALFWPGLRIGWIRASEPVISHLTRLKSVVDMGGSVVSQDIAARLLGHIDTVRDVRRAEIRECMDAFLSESEKYLPEWQLRRPDGGISLWFHIPRGSATEFSQICLLHGVAVVPGASLTADGSCDDFVRIQFIQHLDDIRAGVRRLAQAWLAYTSGRGRALGTALRAGHAIVD